MSRLRPVRSGLALLLPVAFLLFLLAYETRSTYHSQAETGRTPEPLASVSSLITTSANPDQWPVTTRFPAGDATAATKLATAELATAEMATAELATSASDANTRPVPEPEATPPAFSPLITITVEAGQTLAGIAATHGATLETIQKLNGIFDPNYLPVGLEIMVPDGSLEGNLATMTAGPVDYTRQVIGTSAGGYPIESFVFGDGSQDVVVIGGIHGGYEWNSVLLAYRFLDYFGSQPGAVPENVRLHIIPAGNPDGVAAVTGQTGPFAAAAISGDTTLGRPNGNGVDLNRNWGCDWSTKAQWRQQAVSPGSAPFSEPETRALRDYLNQDGIRVVIWLHSAAGLVIPAGCDDVLHEPSEAAAALYGEASGYPVGAFTAYPISGDAGNWLAQQDIASFTVELSDHQNVESDRNLRGLLALLDGIERIKE